MNNQIKRRAFVRRSLIGSLAMATTPKLARTQTRTTGPLSEAFLARLPQMLEWANVPGLSVAVVKDGKYAQFLTRLLENAPQDSLSLSAATRREMFAPQIKINSALNWGLGWGLEQEQGRSFFWHWGDNGNFKAFALGEPARRLGIVVLTNASNGHKLWQRIVTQVTGHDHAAFLFWMV